MQFELLGKPAKILAKVLTSHIFVWLESEKWEGFRWVPLQNSFEKSNLKPFSLLVYIWSGNLSFPSGRHPILLGRFNSLRFAGFYINNLIDQYIFITRQCILLMKFLNK